MKYFPFIKYPQRKIMGYYIIHLRLIACNSAGYTSRVILFLFKIKHHKNNLRIDNSVDLNVFRRSVNFDKFRHDKLYNYISMRFKNGYCGNCIIINFRKNIYDSFDIIVYSLLMRSMYQK